MDVEEAVVDLVVIWKSIVYLLFMDVFGSVVYLLAVDVFESVVGYGEKADDKSVI